MSLMEECCRKQKKAEAQFATLRYAADATWTALPLALFRGGTPGGTFVACFKLEFRAEQAQEW